MILIRNKHYLFWINHIVGKYKYYKYQVKYEKTIL